MVGSRVRGTVSKGIQRTLKGQLNSKRRMKSSRDFVEIIV